MSMTATNDDSSPIQTLASTPITIALTAVLLIVIITGFFSLFFCRCFLKKLLLAWNLQHTPSGELVRAASPPENLGLDPKIIQSFPAFSYSSVKDKGMECSICLSDFSDEDTVRLITACRHAFHTDCIDLWFESHKTCPVCRCELDPDQTSPEKPLVLPGMNLDRPESHESLHDAVMIVVHEDIPNSDGENPINNSNLTGESHERQTSTSERRFLRSHSTGHSIVWPRIDDDDQEEEEKYSLRLLENVNVKITRGHNQTESCITFGELTRFDRLGEYGWRGDTSIGSISRIRV